MTQMPRSGMKMEPIVRMSMRMNSTIAIPVSKTGTGEVHVE